MHAEGTPLQAAVYTLSGATAGALATVATHPFDVMKVSINLDHNKTQA